MRLFPINQEQQRLSNTISLHKKKWTLLRLELTIDNTCPPKPIVFFFIFPCLVCQIRATSYYHALVFLHRSTLQKQKTDTIIICNVKYFCFIILYFRVLQYAETRNNGVSKEQNTNVQKYFCFVILWVRVLKYAETRNNGASKSKYEHTNSSHTAFLLCHFLL